MHRRENRPPSTLRLPSSRSHHCGAHSCAKRRRPEHLKTRPARVHLASYSRGGCAGIAFCYTREADEDNHSRYANIALVSLQALVAWSPNFGETSAGIESQQIKI